MAGTSQHCGARGAGHQRGTGRASVRRRGHIGLGRNDHLRDHSRFRRDLRGTPPQAARDRPAAVRVAGSVCRHCPGCVGERLGSDGRLQNHGDRCDLDAGLGACDRVLLRLERAAHRRVRHQGRGGVEHVVRLHRPPTLCGLGDVAHAHPDHGSSHRGCRLSRCRGDHRGPAFVVASAAHGSGPCRSECPVSPAGFRHCRRVRLVWRQTGSAVCCRGRPDLGGLALAVAHRRLPEEAVPHE